MRDLSSRFIPYLFIWLLPPAILGATAPIDPKDPPAGRFTDEWAEVHMAGGKVGYMHSTMMREGDRIHTRIVTKMRIGRVDSPVEIDMVQTTTEQIDGTPLRFASRMDAATMQTETEGTITDGAVTIKTSQFGMTQTQTFDYPEGALMQWGLYRESLRRGFKPGTEYTLPVYAPELRLDGPIEAVTVIGDHETFEHHGEKHRGQKVAVTMNTPMGSLEMISWVDKTGRPLKAVIPAPGLGDMVMYTVDQQTALADFVPPEMFMKTVIKADRKLDLDTVRRIRYRIRATSPDIDLGTFPETTMQKVAARGDGFVELVLEKSDYRPPKRAVDSRSRRDAAVSGVSPRGRPASDNGPSTTSTPREPDLTEYLTANLMINTDDPELIKLARRAAGTSHPANTSREREASGPDTNAERKANGPATDPYALADGLRRFVSNYVSDKNLNIGFATASEVCRQREGDCSEHGVLLAALGRINGLPSRVAVGLAYVPAMGGQSDIFGYHMWTQFYIDGRWLDYDSAINQAECSPTRIAFATSSLHSIGLADLSLPLISKIGAIDIDILEVHPPTD